MNMMIVEPHDAWLATQGHLQIQLQQATYDTWVRDARFVSCEDNIFTISVRNAYAKDWLENRLHRVLQRTLSSILQYPVEIKILVQAPVEKIEVSHDDEPPLLKFASLPARQESASPASLISQPKEKSPVHFAQGEQLNGDYLLENFVASDCNQLAQAAAHAIAAATGKVYNPLFVHGGVGLGKTHLLQAIGNACREKGLKILYVSAETFTNDLIRAIRTQQTEAFRNFYRQVDVLLVDDIQFIGGKDSTQQEFFHTFNALHNLNRQIVLAGDRRAKNMEELDERLRSRFESGLVVELLPPNARTREEILIMKARAQDIELPDGVAELIAEHVQSCVRDLEGVLNQIIAQGALTRQPITLDAVAMLMEGHVPVDRTQQMEIMDIFEATARYHQLTFDDLLSKQRSQAVAMARHIAIYMAREEINATLPAIGRALGGRSHSTIINSYRKVADMIASDPVFRQEMKALREEIHQQFS